MKNKYINRLLPLVLTIISLASSGVKSSAQAQKPIKSHTYTIEVGQFDHINLTDRADVIYRCVPDSAGLAVFSCEEEISHAYILTNNDGKLRIQVATEDVNDIDLPVLHVYSDFVTSLENSSTGTLTANIGATVPSLSIKLIGNGKIICNNINSTKVVAQITTGNGEIILDGKCRKADFKMLGTGLIQADNLKATDVNCKILGSGSIGCNASSNLDVRGIGSTKIYYKGEPKIKKVGGGKLFPLTASSAEKYSNTLMEHQEDTDSGNEADQEDPDADNLDE